MQIHPCELFFQDRQFIFPGLFQLIHRICFVPIHVSFYGWIFLGSPSETHVTLCMLNCLVIWLLVSFRAFTVYQFCTPYKYYCSLFYLTLTYIYYIFSILTLYTFSVHLIYLTYISVLSSIFPFFNFCSHRRVRLHASVITTICLHISLYLNYYILHIF